MNSKELARALLGTSTLPPYAKQVAMQSRQAKAYHALQPYPGFSNMGKNWKTEDQGPYPRCRPFVQNIVNKGATWLFGKPVSFRVSEGKDKDNHEATELVNDLWKGNDMTRRSRVAAVIGALSGGVVAKYSLPEGEEYPRIDLLDPAEQTRLFYDPQDSSILLMARIQYPVFDAVKNAWYWYREDWTDETYRIYEPMNAEVATNQPFTNAYALVHLADQSNEWKVKSETPNPFGIIPVWYIQNRDVGAEFGEGDLWTMYDLIDQINYTHNLAHVDNQKNVNGTNIYIDLGAPSEEGASVAMPGSDIVVESINPEKPGSVHQLQTNAALRPHLSEFADALRHELLNAVGSVEFRPDEITNKGNLTSAVMMQMYAPLVERTNEKRQCYGEDGFCVFLERMSIGLSNLGVEGWQPMEDIQIVWSPYFEQTEDEKTALASREIMLVQNDLTTHERAVREIAKADGVQDVDELIESVLANAETKNQIEEQNNSVIASAMERQRRGLGG